MAKAPEKVTKLEGQSADLFNAVRGMSSNYFKANVAPMADYSREARLAAVNAMGSDFTLWNEFYSNLANRIAFVFGTSRAYYNKYQSLKKGMLEYGEVIEEVFVQAAQPHHYNPQLAETEIYKRVISDVRTAFHVINARFFYKSTIQKQSLEMAFTTERGLYDLVGQIIASMVNGKEIDEQNIIKWIFARAVLDARIKTVEVPGGETKDDSYSVAKIMKETVDNMTFPSTEYNEAGVLNWTDYPFIKFFLSTKFGSRYSIDVLSASFQLEYTNFMGELLKYDSLSNIDFDRLSECLDMDVKEFTEDEKEALDKVMGFSFDEYFTQVYTKREEWGEQPNREGLYWQNWLHSWGVFSSSPFAPCVAYVTEIGEVTGITVSPTSATLSQGATLPLTVTVQGTGIYSKEVTYTSSDPTNVPVSADGVVTVKGTPITNVTITVKSVQTPSVTKTCTIKKPTE